MRDDKKHTWNGMDSIEHQSGFKQGSASAGGLADASQIAADVHLLWLPMRNARRRRSGALAAAACRSAQSCASLAG